MQSNAKQHGTLHQQIHRHSYKTCNKDTRSWEFASPHLKTTSLETWVWYWMDSFIFRGPIYGVFQVGGWDSLNRCSWDAGVFKPLPPFTCHGIRQISFFRLVPSGHETWQWKMDDLSVILLLEPPFLGDFPASHV